MFTIRFDPSKGSMFSAWMNYAARHDADLSYEDRVWTTANADHAAKARRCGLEVVES